jgi:TonB family protein
MKNALLITLLLLITYDLKAQTNDAQRIDTIGIAQITIEVPKITHIGEGVFVSCDDQIDATFPGGIDKFNQYVVKNIRYPDFAKKHHIQGKVYLNFIIDKDGRIKSVRISRGVSKDINEEAIRVLKSSPKWNPTKMCGKAIKTEYAIAINFSLDK